MHHEYYARYFGDGNDYALKITLRAIIMEVPLGFLNKSKKPRPVQPAAMPSPHTHVSSINLCYKFLLTTFPSSATFRIVLGAGRKASPGY